MIESHRPAVPAAPEGVRASSAAARAVAAVAVGLFVAAALGGFLVNVGVSAPQEAEGGAVAAEPPGAARGWIVWGYSALLLLGGGFVFCAAPAFVCFLVWGLLQRRRGGLGSLRGLLVSTPLCAAIIAIPVALFVSGGLRTLGLRGLAALLAGTLAGLLVMRSATGGAGNTGGSGPGGRGGEGSGSGTERPGPPPDMDEEGAFGD